LVYHLSEKIIENCSTDGTFFYWRLYRDVHHQEVFAKEEGLSKSSQMVSVEEEECVIGEIYDERD
jgi:hypothetical protein